MINFRVWQEVNEGKAKSILCFELVLVPTRLIERVQTNDQRREVRGEIVEKDEKIGQRDTA